MMTDSQTFENSSLENLHYLRPETNQISSYRQNPVEDLQNVTHDSRKLQNSHTRSEPIQSESQVNQSGIQGHQSQQNPSIQANQEDLFQQPLEHEPYLSLKDKQTNIAPSTNQTEILIPQTIQDFKVIKFIGKGTFGQVFLVETQNKIQYAIKTFRLITIQQQQKIRKQAKIMFSVEHPNVMDAKYFFPYNNETSLAIVLQYCPDGDLRKFLGKLTSKKILQIQLQINKGLRYLHNKGIIHRDIKLQNILMKNGKPKLSDLGLAEVIKIQDEGGFWTRWVPGWLSGWVGTKSYMSPEVFHGANYSKQADIWSLGIVMLELCTGKRITQLTEEKNQKQEKLKPAQIQGFPSKDVLAKIQDEQMRAIVEGMLQRDPFKRTSLQDIEKKIEQKKTHDFNKLEEDQSEQLPSATGEELVNLFEGNRKFPNIQKVILIENELNDQSMKAFAQNGDKFPILQEVKISSDKVSDKGLKHFTQNGRKFPFLKTVQLGSGQISDVGLRILLENGQNFPRLEFIVFGNNKITDKGKNEINQYQTNFSIYFCTHEDKYFSQIYGTE